MDGPTFNFEDISVTGTPVVLADDGETAAMAIGFNFDFYGTTRTQFGICANGFVKFAAGGGCPFISQPIPTRQFINAAT